MFTRAAIVSFVLLAVLTAGCVPASPDIRYYNTYNKPSNANNVISGVGFVLWMSSRYQGRFTSLDTESSDWRSLQQSMPTFSIERAFYSRDNGALLLIARSRYKQSYEAYERKIRASNQATILESDRRLVNGAPVLYIRNFLKDDDGNRTISSSYVINDDSVSFLLVVAIPEDEYGASREMIQDVLNGFALN